MPRPKMNRRLISVYLAETGVESVDAIAADWGVTRSDVLRLALKHGLPAAERELRRLKPR